MRNYNRTPETDFEKLHAAVEHLQDAFEILLKEFNDSTSRRVKTLAEKAGKLLDEIRLGEK